MGGVDRLAVGVSFDIHVDIGLLVEDLSEFGQSLLATLVDTGASRFEKKFVRHGNIDFPIFFADGQFVAAKPQKRILYAVEQVLYSFGLCIDHIL